ncbi:hypothetical protein [Amycolatopsis sp. w19]|uniref:hypothetical protein n=1 Tax=Amycolatopsis sp. w19 TaxID=3448134 RepID=UPI003F19F8F6
MERTPRPMPERISKRIARLESLLDTPPRDSASAFDAATKARRALVAVRSIDEPLRMVRVRSALFGRDDDEEGPTRIQHISTSKGAALKVLLLVLFELQARPPSRTGAALVARTMLPLDAKSSVAGGELSSWITFSALPTKDSTRRTTFAGDRRRNRLRQLHSALDRLQEHGRIELRKPRGAHNRYESFWVLDEGRLNDGAAGRVRYTVPELGAGSARRKITTIPVEFFLNGWIDALNDNEIITYLVLRLMAQSFPGQHAANGVFLTSSFRETTFNLDRGFEAHRMLARYGLIRTHRDPRRTVRGTIHQQSPEDTGNLHRFQLDDEALNRSGPQRVITCLQRYAEHESLDDSLIQDLKDASKSAEPAAEEKSTTGSFFAG